MSILLTSLAPMPVAMAQSGTAISPFVSYVPSGVSNPRAGMALTFGGTTGLALRGSADMSISNPKAGDPAATPGGYRPWAADADAMLFLGGLGGGATVFSRALSPYVFSGIGLTGGDSAGTNVVRNGWSYGAGATIPLGFDADLFGEARWRMSQYVLPTAKDAPDSKSEMRFGLSFHVGGSRGEPRRRGRYADADDDATNVAVVSPAPVIVRQPVVVTEPVVVSEPVSTVVSEPEPVVVTRRAEQPTRRVETVTTTRTRSAVVRSGRRTVYRSRTQTQASAKSTTTASSRTTVSGTKKSKREIMRRKRD